MNRRVRRDARVTAVLVFLGLLFAMAGAASAGAETFIADPSIADTSASSACTSPCSLRQAVKAAQKLEEETFGIAVNTIELRPGTYTLTEGPLRLEHPFVSSGEQPELIEGLASRASEVVLTAAGKSRVIVDGAEGGTSGLVELRRMKITGGNGEGGIAEPDPNEPKIGEGGAIAIEQNGTLTLDEVAVEGNTASSAGGGIEDAGELIVENSTVAHNTVTGGGGFGLGGGISSDNLNNKSHELLTVVNSTIADNTVSGGSKGQGGGIFNGTALVLTNSTISGDSAPGTGGGGLAAFESAGLGETKIANSIIAYNQGKDCAGTTPTSLGGNDVDDTSCNLSAQSKENDTSSDPGLERETETVPKLTDNGGPTGTIAISSAGSPPSKNGLAANCPKADQRGAARPEGAACSSGAYQWAGKPGVIVGASASPQNGGTLAAKTSINGAVCQAASCTLPAEAKGTVKIAQSPAAGYALLEWTGCSKVSSGECEVEVNGADRSVTATFTKRFTITGTTEAKGTRVSAQGSGAGASCSGGTCTVNAGETVTLTAESTIPNIQFQGWSGPSCSANPCTIEHVSASETDIANFILGPPLTAPEHTMVLYVSSAGNGAGGETPANALPNVEALEERLDRDEEREEREEPNTEILFADGTYGALKFGVGRNQHISVYGDLNPNTWKPEAHPAEPTTFVGSPQGLLLDGSTGMSFQQVDFQGVAGPTGSVYGVRMISGSSATFTDVGMTAGNAPAGAQGANGATGAAGGNGEAGGPGLTPGDVRGLEAELAARAGFSGVEFQQLATCPGVDQHGNWGNIYSELATLYAPYSACGSLPAAPGSQWTREPGDGGIGGWGGWLHGSGGGGRAGGEGAAAIDDNAVGAAGGQGGSAGEAESSWCCENGKSATSSGTAGKGGEQGPQGADQSTQPTSAAGLYQQGAGVRGGAGFSGGGGGGGAGGSGDFDIATNGAGDGGGAGGAGGFGGEGGAGGEEGGGSFGLYLAEGSKATVQAASELSSGRGGPGGSGGSGGGGGAGGSGGKGSAYAANTIGAGSNGGAGGGGGPGGGGGGGAGGPSFAVFGPGETVELAPDTVEHVGSPGLGGYPGGWGGEPAPSGGGGPNSPCSANCKVNQALSVQLPYVAPVSGGKLVTLVLACHVACRGKLTLSVHSVKGRVASAFSDRARSTQIGKLSFSLRASRRTALHIVLNRAGRALIKRLKRFTATLHVEVKLAGSHHATSYSQSVALAAPPAPRKK